MKRTLQVLLIAFAACSARDPAPPSPARLPPVLHHMVLAENSDEIGPVEFPHGFHNDDVAMGRNAECVDCHHTVRDVPGSLPAPCVRCHPMEPEEGKQPDL